MSDEKRAHEAGRWLSQAKADLKAAQASRQAGSFEWSCFQCQQSGEKALKAVWMAAGYDPWGHSLIRLVDEYPDPSRRSDLRGCLEQARLLDKLYIPTRYPNGLPDLTPSEVYAEPDAAAALQAAERILRTAQRMLDAP